MRKLKFEDFDWWYLSSSSWIRRGGPPLAVVEQFEFLINDKYILNNKLRSNCPTTASSGPPLLIQEGEPR